MGEHQGLEDLSRLLARAQAGDEDAVRSLQGLGQELRLMVRVRLPRELRSQFDSMDFVQDVWQSFLRKMREDPSGLQDIQNLRRYLVGAARNKVMEEHRRQTTRKHSIDRKENIYVKKGGREVPREVPCSAPTPVESAQARDQIAQLLRKVDPLTARIVGLKQEGLTFEEIGRRVNMHERSVRRIFDTVRREAEGSAGG
jgi:RNA polymerase sigma-70 factor (ECF subfamily)